MTPIRVKYANRCAECRGDIYVGELALWDKQAHTIKHIQCKINRQAVECDGYVGLQFERNSYLIERLKQIGRVKWHPKSKLWIANPTPIQAHDLIEFITQNQFEANENITKLLLDLQAKAAFNYAQSGATSTEFKPKNLKGQTYEYQNVAIELGIKNKKVLISDDMGCGKSLESLGVAAYLNAKPILIVCPAIAKGTWADEIARWTDLQPQIVSGQTPYPLESNVVIINYDILQYWLPVLLDLNPRLVIFDEIHYCRHHRTGRAKAAQRLAKGREYIIGLSGTPIINGPAELINILNILGVLDDFGGFKYWFDNYREATPEKLIEINNKLRWSGIYIRRTSQQVLPFLPKLTRQRLLLDIDNREAYTRAERELAEYIAETKIADLELDNLDQLAEEFDKETRKAKKYQHLLKWNALGQLAAMGKTNQTIEWIADFLKTGNKLTVFSYYRVMQSKLLEAFPTALHLFSTDSESQREIAKKEFQEGDAQLILCGLKVANININLTAGHYNLTTCYAWTPADHLQAEKRQSRIGQQYPVWCGYMTGRDTIDEDRYSIINAKMPVTESVIEGKIITTNFLNDLTTKLLEKYRLGE